MSIRTGPIVPVVVLVLSVAVQAAIPASVPAATPAKPAAAAPTPAPAAEDLPVIPESAQFTQLIEQAIVRTVNTPSDRDFPTTRVAAGGQAVGTVTTAGYKNVPDTVTFVGYGGGCPVMLGWEWMSETRGGKITAKPAPTGALVRLEEPLKLGATNVPARTILEHNARGWSILTDAQAVARMRAILAMPAPPRKSESEDPRAIGVLGAAVIGPPAAELVPLITRAANTGEPGAMIAYAAQAFWRIGDPSAIPALRQMRARARDLKVVVDVVDSAMAALRPPAKGAGATKAPAP